MLSLSKHEAHRKTLTGSLSLATLSRGAGEGVLSRC